MIDFSTLQALTVPEGVVTKIESGGVVLWELQTTEPIVLEVKKITSNTYVGSTTYNGETFILLDIYPRSGGTVTVTYGDLTKTVVDDGTSEVPNAQEVFFGTYNGVTDEVETPDSGTLTIRGDCAAFGSGVFKKDKTFNDYYTGITNIGSFGSVEFIPDYAFMNSSGLPIEKLPDGITSLGMYAFYHCENATFTEIPEGVETIGAFCFNMECVDNVPKTSFTTMTFPSTLKEIGSTALVYSADEGTHCVFSEVRMLAIKPPTLPSYAFGELKEGITIPTIIVPAGYGEVYKTAPGFTWSTYADYIVEASE